MALDQNEIIALHSIAHYYTTFVDSEYNREAIAAELKLTRSSVNNFFQKASPGGEGEDSAISRLHRYFESKLNLSEKYYTYPLHIRNAIRVAYNYTPPTETIDEIMSAPQTGDKQYIDEFCQEYAGVYDVFRYAAHLESELKTYDLEDGTVGAWMVRASLEILPSKPGQEMPDFVLHYRPGPISDTGGYSIATGKVIIVDRTFFYFVGYEQKIRFPIFIACAVSELGKLEFRGLVLRRHGEGRLFSSRVIIRLSKKKTLAELNREIGIAQETRWIAEIGGSVLRMHNRIEIHGNSDIDGKGVLIL